MILDAEGLREAIWRNDAREPPTDGDRLIIDEALRDLLRAMEAKNQQVVGAFGPRWLFRELTGGFWEIGEESNPVRLKSIKGFADMAYALAMTDCNISPWALPGAPSKRCNKPIDTTPCSGAYITQGPWIGFGSDEVSDTSALHEYRDRRAELADLIEIAIETGDFDLAEALHREWKWYKQEMNNSLVKGYRPGQEHLGRRKKLNTADPVIKATRSARDRKKTAIQKFREAGLGVIADYLNASYIVQTRNIVYIPQEPFPVWILD